MDDAFSEEYWGRTARAQWQLQLGDAEAAAMALQPGDDLALAEAAFPELARALHQQGLAALYEDGRAFVYTPAEALKVLAEMEQDARAGLSRLPPARSPAPVARPPQAPPAVDRRPAIRATRIERAAAPRAAGGFHRR